MNVKVYTQSFAYLFTVFIPADYYRWINANVSLFEGTPTTSWDQYKQFVEESGLND